MTEIELSITRLAALGRSPYQIEVELGFPPYTIHQKYHAALQEGYARMARRQDSKSKELTTPAEPIKRQEKTMEEMSQREKLAETRRLYYQSHRSEIREKQRRYYLANKEKVAQYQRQYHQANKRKIAETRREYYRANKEKFAEWSRQYKARKRREKITQQGESAWPENQMPTGDQNGAGLK